MYLRMSHRKEGCEDADDVLMTTLLPVGKVNSLQQTASMQRTHCSQYNIARSEGNPSMSNAYFVPSHAVLLPPCLHRDRNIKKDLRKKYLNCKL